MDFSIALIGTGFLIVTFLFLVGWNRFMKYRRLKLGDTDPRGKRPSPRPK